MGGGFTMIFTLVILGGMMFFMTRSQKKQQKERQNLLDSMKVGDKVITIGGLHGVISEFDETNRTVLLDCEGIVLEFERSAIRTVKPNGTAVTPEPVAVSEEVKETVETEEAAPVETEQQETVVSVESTETTEAESTESAEETKE